jgi:hypothetical protein
LLRDNSGKPELLRVMRDAYLTRRRMGKNAAANTSTTTLGGAVLMLVPDQPKPEALS